MDKVVERWVTTSKPLESRGLWKRFVQERNQVLPQPKPSKSISDKYQDYLKAESYLEPKSQMFVRDEMGFDEGGLATPKRGLVDGPGSYRGDPAYKKKWYEENKERLLKEQREKYKALSPEEKTRKAQKSIEFQKTEEGKKIRAERHKIRKLAKDPLSPGDKKMLDRFKLNLKYSKVVNDIIANHNGMRPNPETLSELVQVHYEVDPEFQKAWKQVSGDVPFSSTNLSPASLEHNYKRAMGATKKVTADNFKKELEGLIESEIEGTGTTYDEFMENGLRLNETYLNDNYKSPTKKAQYQRRYKKVLRSGIGWDPEGKGAQSFFADPKLKTSTIPTKLNARLGTKGFYEPGKFVRAHYFGTIQAKKLYDLGLLSEEAAKNFKERYTWKPDYINVLQGNTYDADVYKAILKYNKHKDKSLLAKDLNLAATNAKKLGLDVDELAFDNKTKKFNFIDKGRVFQKGGDRELRYLAKNAINEIANVEASSGKVLGSASEADIRKAYGKRSNRIIKQIQTGIDYKYPNLDKKMTKAIGRVDSKQLAQGLNKILDCKLAAGVNCDDPMSYYKSLKEQEKIAATGKGANKLKAINKVRAAKNLLYGTIGPAALAVEGAIAAPLAGYEFLQGALPSEILNTATYGIAGKDRDEIIQEGSSEEIFKPRDFMETGERLESLYSDPITGGYRGRYDRTKAIEDTEKKFRDQYYDSYFAHPKTGDFSESIFNLRLKEQQAEEAKYQKQRDQLKQERADKYTNVSSGLDLPEFAGGGIAGVRRPHAIPPKSGPMPQGGGLSSMFNRVRKW